MNYNMILLERLLSYDATYVASLLSKPEIAHDAPITFFGGP